MVLTNVSKSCPQIWPPVKSPFSLENYEESILNGYVERGLFKSSLNQVGNVSNRRVKRGDSTHFGTVNIIPLIEEIRQICRKYLPKFLC